MTVMEYCVFAQRLGASQRAALEAFRRFRPEYPARAFGNRWRAARAAEELAGRYPGLQRETWS